MYSYKDFLSKKLSYSKELYEQESKVRQQSSSKFAATITLYIAIITAWIALFSSTVKNVDIEAVSLLEIILFTILLSTIILIIISVSFFVCCFINYNEETIEPTQVNDILIDSENLFNQYEPDEVINNIDNIMANSYMKCAINNFEQNFKKIKLLNKAYVFILIIVVCLLIAFLFNVLM